MRFACVRTLVCVCGLLLLLLFRRRCVRCGMFARSLPSPSKNKQHQTGGLTPMLRAVLNHDRSLVRVLAEAGADPNAFSNRSGLNGLCWACRRGDVAMVEQANTHI